MSFWRIAITTQGALFCIWKKYIYLKESATPYPEFFVENKAPYFFSYDLFYLFTFLLTS